MGLCDLQTARGQDLETMLFEHLGRCGVQHSDPMRGPRACHETLDQDFLILGRPLGRRNRIDPVGVGGPKAFSHVVLLPEI